MTDKVIDPTALTAEDEQSLHARVISDNTPEWYTGALDARKTELAALDLRIPDWYKQASAADRERMKEVHLRSRRSLNHLDQLFSPLKNPADYAEPLLVAEIEKTFGQRLDVRKVFYARKMEQKECNPGPEEVPTDRVSALEPQFYFYKGLSLLEAALNNFTEDEAKRPVCSDCHLITRYDFHRYPASKLHVPANVQALKLDIEAHEFAAMCRRLDLGGTYFEYMRSGINAHILPQPSGARPGKLYATLMTSHRNQVELAAEIALMKGDIQPSHYALIKAILIKQAGNKWGKDIVSFCRFKLYSFQLDSILVIGPVVWEDLLVNSELRPRPCMVYIPGDPLHPLKAYDNIGAFTEHLTTRLCAVEYRQFFSQFVPLSEQDGFYSKLKTLLDPGGNYTPDQDFDAAKKSKITEQGHYGHHWSDLWYESAVKRVCFIMDNVSSSAVSTADITKRAYNAWLWSWGSKALDILNLAAFVVPFLGEAMLVVGAIQMIYEVCEGISAWSDGDTRATWAHFSAMALNLAGLAVPKVLLVAKDTAIVRRLVHVEFGGRTRLYDFNPASYRHQLALPSGLKPDARGLYAHEGRTYLPVEDGHYQVQAAQTGDDFRLIHPDGESRYAPRIRHNGEGAWVHEFEQPQTWDRSTLLRRLGPRVEKLSDSQLEQIRLISGVTDDELRRVYVDQQLPPPLFRETLRRFEWAGKHQAFIEQLSSADPQVSSRADWALQLKVLVDTGMWPKSKVLVVFDAQGDLVWRSADVKARGQVVKLDVQEIENGGLVPLLLNQLSEPEIRHLLNEAGLKRLMRGRVAMAGGLELDDTAIPRPKNSEELDAQVERLMQEWRTPQARALRYRDQLLGAAKRTRGKLFRDEVTAGELSSDRHVQLIQRHFPGLPKLVAEELVDQANSRDLTRMDSTSRLPLRLAEEARNYLQKARLMRAHTDQLFDSEMTMDSVHLALHKLAALPGRLEGVGIELRAGAYDGEVLGRVGRADAPRQFRLVRMSMKEWAVYSGPKTVEYWRSDPDAFYSALWIASNGQFSDFPGLRASTQALKAEIAAQPLSEQASRQALGMQAIKPGFKSPMRLSDGRFGYPLSPVGGTGGGMTLCEMNARSLYPSKTFEETIEMLGLQGRGEAVWLARLNQLQQEFTQLDKDLVAWQQEGESGYRRARRRVSASIKDAWQRLSPQAFAADQTPIGHVLELTDEAIGELPALTANMDHVGSLVLHRLYLSDSSLPFLESFGGLRWLNMRENNLTRLPEFANGGTRLTKLNLSRNDIQLTEQSRARLEAMQNLKILNLSDNRRLGWTADLRGMRNLNQLYLHDTGTTTFPAGAERLTHLARIDLHTNRITTLPEYAYQHPERINVHDNPLSAATLARLHGEIAQQWDDHVTAAEARTLWLRDVPPSERAQRGELWDDVLADPESNAFFTVLADTTRSAEYASQATRSGLAARLWDMLEATRESQEIRETLFSTADDRVTCGDGSTVEFMNLERALIGARALALAGEANAEGALVGTARKLFRLHLVDAIAQRDVEARGPGFTEQVEVIMAYRIKLADRLELPIKTREMLFPHQANVSEAAIDEAYEHVIRDEQVAADETTFFVAQGFWQKHLRSRYAQELEALMAPARAQLTEKAEALEELSEWQTRQASSADPAQWQARHHELVDTLGRLLGKRRDEILVDGSMQSAFYVEQYNALGVEQLAQETQAMGTLTRSVLNNFAAVQGTDV
ncbi:NEL-type E3 ubiquitin ligase domain-containing protein [Pseudomonas extremaustralis]|nr:NEL-type E3 ubiquitin ligase domain-containing protein [Pseudomonas extremaustralis]SDE79481.1 C-terminal novel E3 ligase, LRR-interacting [Pseudomonas extremaustralis]